MLYEVKDRSLLEPYFKDCQDGVVLSCLHNHMGKAYAMDETMRSIMLIVDVFAFFAGNANPQFVAECITTVDLDFLILTPMQSDWIESFETCGITLQKSERYAIKKKQTPFDIAQLNGYINRIYAPYTIKRIEQKEYHEIKKLPWAYDLCAQYDDAMDYEQHGVGFIVLKEDTIVAGASSYVHYRGGIEIEVDTLRAERRKGLALACCAALIKACVEHGLYPNWDGQNMGSVALAEKLGYQFDRAYIVYEYERSKEGNIQKGR